MLVFLQMDPRNSVGSFFGRSALGEPPAFKTEKKRWMPGASMGDPTHDKVMQRRPDEQGGSGLEGALWTSLSICPQTRIVCHTILCLSPTLLALTGGYPWPPFSGENQLRALANRSPGHERNISNQTPSVSILACLAGLSRLLQLRIRLFTASQLWEAWEA